MATVHKSFSEFRADPFRFSPDDRARLDAMTDDEVTRAAEADPDNPPWTDEELARGELARGLRLARKRVGQTQEAFAAALGLPVATMRNWEQGRFSPDPAARALMKLVSRDPERSLKVLAE